MLREVISEALSVAFFAFSLSCLSCSSLSANAVCAVLSFIRRSEMSDEVELRRSWISLFSASSLSIVASLSWMVCVLIWLVSLQTLRLVSRVWTLWASTALVRSAVRRPASRAGLLGEVSTVGPEKLARLSSRGLGPGVAGGAGALLGGEPPGGESSGGGPPPPGGGGPFPPGGGGDVGGLWGEGC